MVLKDLVDGKIKGIINYSTGEYSNLVSAGAVDILEKIKTYKQEDLQKFIKEHNVHDTDSTIWTNYNAIAINAWNVMGAKRSIDRAAAPDHSITPTGWKNASLVSESDKSDLIDPYSLKYITNSYPAYTVESHIDVTEDGDNDNFLTLGDDANYIVTIFPYANNLYHAWKIRYIPIPGYSTDSDILTNFHSSYIPALAVYIAKNIVLGEMNRLLLNEEDTELASELKNHYALLEQEYAGLMNIPPKKEAK